MVIDLVTIPVALIRVGLWVAEKVEIQAIKFALNEAAKAALKAAEQEAKRALQLGAMAGPEAAAKEAFWRAASVTPRQFSEVEVKTWTAKIASRMKQLGIPEKNIGAKVRKFPPSRWGKLSTFVQIVAAVAWLVTNIWPVSVLHAISSATLWVSAGFTVWSGTHYTLRGVQTLRAR